MPLPWSTSFLVQAIAAIFGNVEHDVLVEFGDQAGHCATLSAVEVIYPAIIAARKHESAILCYPYSIAEARLNLSQV
jgi:hypothetical protein